MTAAAVCAAVDCRRGSSGSWATPCRPLDAAPSGSGPGASAAVGVVAWCGMRGIVTLAAALALPDGVPDPFPYRDLILFTAFCVVLGTLVLQGMTLRPLMRVLALEDDGSVEREVRLARAETARAALAAVEGGASGGGDGPAAAPEVRGRLRRAEGGSRRRSRRGATARRPTRPRSGGHRRRSAGRLSELRAERRDRRRRLPPRRRGARLGRGQYRA